MQTDVASCKVGDVVFVNQKKEYMYTPYEWAARHAEERTPMIISWVDCETLSIRALRGSSPIALRFVEGEFLRAESAEEARSYMEREDSASASPTVGVKYDGDKPRMDLLTAGMPDALLEIGKVLTFGAKKYDDHNWRIVPDGEKRYAAAAMRHFLASQAGERNDPETGLSHLAHMACCVLFLLQKDCMNVNNRDGH